MTRGRRAVTRVLGAALIPVAGLASCGRGGPGPELTALRADPMSRASLSGATSERRSEARSGRTLGKPTSAFVRQVFTVDADRDVRVVIEDATAQAIATGWERVTGVGSSPGARFERQAGGGPDILRLSIDPYDLEPPRQKVVMNLEYLHRS